MKEIKGKPVTTFYEAVGTAGQETALMLITILTGANAGEKALLSGGEMMIRIMSS